MELNRNPANIFQETEQVAMAPGNLIPGIEPSEDRLLQGRLFSYADTQMYRLGATHQRNHAGQTPAMFAALFQRTGILQALKARGADMQASDAAGNTVQALGRGEFSAR